MICKISYSPRDELFFNMVRSPLYNFLRSLGSFSKRSLKVRTQITEFSSAIHNINELRKDVDSFMSTNGSKLLETNPKDYENFIEFFYKTQKTNYVNETKWWKKIGKMMFKFKKSKISSFIFFYQAYKIVKF